MTDQKIKLIIEALDKTEDAFNGLKRHLKDSQVDTDALNVKSQGLMSTYKQLASGINALIGAYAGYKALDLGKDAVLAAARYETLGLVMRVVGNNAGYTGEQMESFAKGLEKTGISMSGARDSLTRMAQAQLDLNKSTELARMAQDAARIGNINSTEAFQRLVYGIQSAQTEMLRTIGINVSFETAYQRVAKETGRAATSFTEAEKSAIRMNAVLDKGSTIAGTYTESMTTAAGQLKSLERHFDNLKVLAGAAFTPALAEIVETITAAVTGLNGELNGNGKKAIEEWGANLRLTIISIEAEFMRLGMFIDKLGGTMTQMKMFLSMPGTALGFDASTKNFDAALKQNEAFEKSYKDTEKALEQLALKYNQIEHSLTPAGKASAKAAGDAAEKDRMAAANNKAGAAGGDDKAAKKAAREAAELSQNFDLSANGYDKTGSQHEKMTAMIATSDAMLNKMEMEHRQSEMDELTKSSEYKQTVLQAEHTNALSLNNELAEEEIANTENRLNSYRTMYDDMKGEQGRYYQYMLESLEEQRKIHKLHTENKIAADKWYSEQKKKLDDELVLSGDNLFGGMRLGLESWAKEAGESGRAGFNLVKKAIDEATDALTDLVMTGKADFKSLADSIVRDLIRIEIQKAITWAAGGGKSDTSGKSGLIGTAVSFIGNWLNSANGNVFSGGHLVKYALGGIINRPTIFPMANGAGLMGEAGPEAVIPLKRGADGKLGVAGPRGGGIHISNLNIVGMDTQSFADVCKRNPAAVITPMVEALKSNSSLRYLMIDLLGDS